MDEVIPTEEEISDSDTDVIGFLMRDNDVLFERVEYLESYIEKLKSINNDYLKMLVEHKIVKKKIPRLPTIKE